MSVPQRRLKLVPTDRAVLTTPRRHTQRGPPLEMLYKEQKSQPYLKCQLTGDLMPMPTGTDPVAPTHGPHSLPRPLIYTIESGVIWQTLEQEMSMDATFTM